jgi:hypothetical protein
MRKLLVNSVAILCMNFDPMFLSKPCNVFWYFFASFKVFCMNFSASLPLYFLLRFFYKKNGPLINRICSSSNFLIKWFIYQLLFIFNHPVWLVFNLVCLLSWITISDVPCLLETQFSHPLIYLIMFSY